MANKLQKKIREETSFLLIFFHYPKIFYIFAPAFSNECKDILLYSFTITTANERATTIVGAAPIWAQNSRI